MMEDIAECPGMCSDSPGVRGCARTVREQLQKSNPWRASFPRARDERDEFGRVWLGFGGGRESPLTIWLASLGPLRDQQERTVCPSHADRPLFMGGPSALPKINCPDFCPLFPIRTLIRDHCSTKIPIHQDKVSNDRIESNKHDNSISWDITSENMIKS